MSQGKVRSLYPKILKVLNNEWIAVKDSHVEPGIRPLQYGALQMGNHISIPMSLHASNEQSLFKKPLNQQ